MSIVESVSTPVAPAAIGPYAQATAAGGMIFCSGQIGLSPEDGALVEGGVAAETRQALLNLSAVLKGSRFANCPKGLCSRSTRSPACAEGGPRWGRGAPALSREPSRPGWRSNAPRLIEFSQLHRPMPVPRCLR